MRLSSWLIGHKVINYRGAFQYGLEKTPTLSRHTTVVCSSVEANGICGLLRLPHPLPALERRSSRPHKNVTSPESVHLFIPSHYLPVADFKREPEDLRIRFHGHGSNLKQKFKRVETFWDNLNSSYDNKPQNYTSSSFSNLCHGSN